MFSQTMIRGGPMTYKGPITSFVSAGTTMKAPSGDPCQPMSHIIFSLDVLTRRHLQFQQINRKATCHDEVFPYCTTTKVKRRQSLKGPEAFKSIQNPKKVRKSKSHFRNTGPGPQILNNLTKPGLTSPISCLKTKTRR